MSAILQFRLNPALYLRDPESSELGRSILRHSVALMNELGLEDFTFKKLAAAAGTTEASIYRYFENKHRLLNYILAWWWTWLDYQVMFRTNNIKDPAERVHVILNLLTFQMHEPAEAAHMDLTLLFDLVLNESNKAYLTRHVSEDNKQQFFKPYKDLCARIAGIFGEINKAYRHPRSLASTVLEMAHLLLYFKRFLPALTDYPGPKGKKEAALFLENLVFSALGKK